VHCALDWWQRARARGGQRAWSGPVKSAASLPPPPALDFVVPAPASALPAQAWSVYAVLLWLRAHTVYLFNINTWCNCHTCIHTLSCPVLSHSQQPSCQDWQSHWLRAFR
jgi:hypothetical protein